MRACDRRTRRCLCLIGLVPAAFALANLGLPAGEVVMVGDDVEADIGGAQAAGLRAVQVRTGKYTPRDREHPTIRPDAVIGSIAELPGALAALD